MHAEASDDRSIFVTVRYHVVPALVHASPSLLVPEFEVVHFFGLAVLVYISARF